MRQRRRACLQNEPCMFSEYFWMMLYVQSHVNECVKLAMSGVDVSENNSASDFAFETCYETW